MWFVQKLSKLYNRTTFPYGKDGTFLSRFMASVNIFVDPSEKKNVVEALSQLTNLEEVYEVAGEYDIVSIVSASCLEEFRDVLQKNIMKIKGIKSTVSSIVLKAHKGPKCDEENHSPSPPQA